MSLAQRTHGAALYRQIADALRQRIAGLAPGERLPSEPRLAMDWGVSRFTVARAVQQLVDEGLITRRQGSGTFVAEPPLRRTPGYLLSFTEAIEAAGHTATHRLLTFEPTAWHDRLPYPRDVPLLLLDRLRLVDGLPVARHRSVLAADLVAATGLTSAIATAATFSLYRFLGEHGRSVHSATERLVACMASSDDRKLLGLRRNAVVVAVTRYTYAADGTPLDAVSAIYDARRYSYEARLARQNNAPSAREDDNDQVMGDRHQHLGLRLDLGDRQRQRR